MKQAWNKWLSTQQILSKFYACCCHWYSISRDILPWIITDGHWFCLCSSQRSKINVKVRLKWVPTVSSDLCWKAHFKHRRNGSQLRPSASCIVTINGYKRPSQESSGYLYINFGGEILKQFIEVNTINFYNLINPHQLKWWCFSFLTLYCHNYPFGYVDVTVKCQQGYNNCIGI